MQTIDYRRGLPAMAACFLIWGFQPLYWYMCTNVCGEIDTFFLMACRIIWAAVTCLCILKVQGKLPQLWAVFMDKQVLVLRREYPRNCVTRIDLSQQLPAYCTGLGKALLSTKSEEEIDEYIATVPRTAYTLHTLTDGARLKQDLLAAKEKGYAEDISEISDSLHCVAVPILTPHGGLWAISLSGHCSVIREYGVENIVKHLKKAVWDMTSGYSAAPVA